MFFKSNNTKFSNATLILENGDIFNGIGIGKHGFKTGEICFNTAMTGYQEAITDPSYASQFLMFTFPHIGITGINKEDVENKKIYLSGVIFRSISFDYSSWRGINDLNNWLVKNNVLGITNLNTRDLTIKVRKFGALKAAIVNGINNRKNLKNLLKEVKNWNGIKNLDLAKLVTCKKPYVFKNIKNTRNKINIVAIDFGCKKNILNLLDSHDFRITVVPCTSSYEKIMSYNPEGIFLSNGPGDPFATSKYALISINKLIKQQLPIFGICLGHQLLALALNANTLKMHHGHHGVNQPVKNLATNKIEITSQNHGFMVDKYSLPKYLKISHLSLFDNVIQGIEHKTKPFFSVQYHPESSPGPHDSRYLFEKFRNLIIKNINAKKK